MGFIWLMTDLGFSPVDNRWVVFAVCLYSGLTMVSNVPFYSFKEINLRRSVPFWAILLIVLVMILVSSNPPVILFLGFVIYSFSGYAYWLWTYRERRRSIRRQSL